MSNGAVSGPGYGGVSGFTLLGLVFLVLKLVGVIHWSWWWVLLPFYGPIALAGIILALAAICFVLER